MQFLFSVKFAITISFLRCLELEENIGYSPKGSFSADYVYVMPSSLKFLHSQAFSENQFLSLYCPNNSFMISFLKLDILASELSISLCMDCVQLIGKYRPSSVILVGEIRRASQLLE